MAETPGAGGAGRRKAVAACGRDGDVAAGGILQAITATAQTTADADLYHSRGIQQTAAGRCRLQGIAASVDHMVEVKELAPLREAGALLDAKVVHIGSSRSTVDTRGACGARRWTARCRGWPTGWH
jgi:hypothetical protein